MLDSKIEKIPPDSLTKMKARKGVLHELHFLLRDIKALTAGQCTVSTNDEHSSTRNVRFIVSIIPNSGPYKSGKFDFLFKVSHRYPTIYPDIKCLTHIYHPNIDDCGEICLSLFEDWSPDYHCLMHCVHGLLFLLENPNLEDPLSPYFSPEDADDIESFYQNVRKSLEGGIIDGFITFKRNLVESECCQEISNSFTARRFHCNKLKGENANN